MNKNMPENLKYTNSHEWVRVEGALATIGLTEFAQQQLGEVVFIELPAVGRTLRAGEQCAVVESLKAATDVYAPVSGEVVKVNQAVVDNPTLVNKDPYGAGWFYCVRLSQPAELETLLGPQQYAALAVKTEPLQQD